jgi:hypothetical protein
MDIFVWPCRFRDYWKVIGVYHSPTDWRQRRYAFEVAVKLHVGSARLYSKVRTRAERSKAERRRSFDQSLAEKSSARAYSSASPQLWQIWSMKVPLDCLRLSWRMDRFLTDDLAGEDLRVYCNCFATPFVKCDHMPFGAVAVAANAVRSGTTRLSTTATSAAGSTPEVSMMRSVSGKWDTASGSS